DADDADRRVLALEIGLRAFAHGGGNLLHARVAGVGRQHRANRPDRVEDREHAAGDDQPQSIHGKPRFSWKGRTLSSPEPGRTRAGTSPPCLKLARDIARIALSTQRRNAYSFG